MSETQMSEKEMIIKTCLIAVKVMMANGSEVYRVEDTMNRIAKSAGEPDSISYVTATGLFMSLRSNSYAQIEHVAERSINLQKIVAVNQLSREFSANDITLEELYEHIQKVDNHTPNFSFFLQILCAGIASSSLMYIITGDLSDFFQTFLVGSVGFLVSLLIKRWIPIRFFDMFMASFLVGTMAIFAVRFSLAQEVDNIVIGAVMPLVPGLSITNAFRDVLAGDFISGTTRGIEALCTAAAISCGIATVFTFLGGAF